MEGNAPKWKNDKELRRYAELGDPDAQFTLGERLLNGEGMAREPVDAVRWLEKAAEKGHADAHFRLGKLYHDGEVMPRDYARSFRHYTEAARRGIPEAQHNLGAMLVSARGVKRDFVEGLAWFIVATKSGAVSSAEQQTRDRLAKRPDMIAQAEERAKALWEQLARAPDDVTPKVTFPGEVSRPEAPGVVKPAVEQTPKKVPLSPAPKLEAPKPQLSPMDLPTPPLPTKPEAEPDGGD